MDSLKHEVNKAVETLVKGGLLLYPTDTVWGIGCDATNEQAVQRLLELKGRKPEKGLVLLLDVTGRLESYVYDVPPQAWDLIEFSEKPLTIIYDGAKNLAPSVKAQDGSIAIRITKDEFCKQVIARLKKPLVSTSANLSGQPFPASFSDIRPEILSGVDYIVNLRRQENLKSAPSTLIRLRANGRIEFIRS